MRRASSAFRLVSRDWEHEILAARGSQPQGVRIICPFIKSAALARIIRAGRPKPVQVITRFDLNCFDQGVSDVSALRALVEGGAKVRGVKGLHSKLYIFGGAAVIGTSANVTDAAMRRNHEFGFVAHDKTVVDVCLEYFEELWTKAGADLKLRRLRDWERLLAERRKSNAIQRNSRLPDFGVNVKIQTPFQSGKTSPQFPNQAFVKFSGTGGNRADRGLLIADLVAESGCKWVYTYPKTKPPRQVEDGDVLYIGRLVHTPDDVMIFGKAIGRRHRDEEDVASAREIDQRSWKAHWPLYVRVHDAQFVNATLGDGVSFRQMMEELESDSFMSTQKNAAKGSGNTDPTASYFRKAHMLLTSDARVWVDEQLEPLFRQFGEVNLSEKRFAPLTG